MGQKNNTLRIGIVIAIFLITAIMIFNKPEDNISAKPGSLNEALNTIDGWVAGRQIPYDTVIVESLALDDYVNKAFTNDNATISLYIGYYATAKKVGAAHDPLVCFPGQGWEISGKQKGTVNISPPIDKVVNYATMRVNRSGNSSLLLYWFQAGSSTHSSTFAQKVATIINRIRNNKEDNAFVRLTCHLQGSTTEAECLDVMHDFTKSFYPVFLQYIQN